VVLALALAGGLVWGTASLGGARAAAPDLGATDLSGDWYVLLHYTDDRSDDPTRTKFKDFGWSIRQDAAKIAWEVFPYVVFDEELELVREIAMRRHEPWSPDASALEALRTKLTVSSRAATNKKLRGSRADGFSSSKGSPGGLNTLTFSRDWEVEFAAERVRVKVTDSLSGGMSLEGLEDAIVYEILEVKNGELLGRYSEAHKRGTLRMVPSAERRVLK